jgi:2-dehydropantoate 2-reductase
MVKAGLDVTFLDAWPPLLEAMKADPYAERKNTDGTVERVPVKVLPLDEAPSIPGDLILVTVKTSMTPDTMKRAAARGIIGPSTLVLTFQGGFENPDIIASFLSAEDHCLPAFTSSYCKPAGPMKIENFGINRSTVWPLGVPSTSPAPEPVRAAVDQLNKAGLLFELTPKAVADRWKLLVYYPTNIAVSAVVGLDFGTCWSTPECQELLINLAKECALIAKLEGVDEKEFNEEIAIEVVKELAIDDAIHAGSMVQDVKNKRITEIEGTNGALLRKAKKHGVADLPYTRAVYAMIRTREQHYGKEV